MRPPVGAQAVCGSHIAWVGQCSAANTSRSRGHQYRVDAADTPEADVLHWGEETFQYWLKLFGSTGAAAAGMQLVDAFQLWDVSLLVQTDHSPQTLQTCIMLTQHHTAHATCRSPHQTQCGRTLCQAFDT